jgi:tRNA(Ile)-lysidine synthase
MADVRRAVRENWQHAGVAPGDLVLVACSGGADSLALAAASVFEGARFAGGAVRVGAVIVEHGLQAETALVAANTAAKLRELGLNPVLVKPVKVETAAGQGVEAQAREARYEGLASTAAELGAKFVALGHTMNDQAETVLLGLTRGSGPRSIAGMTATTRAGMGLIYLRPLLGISRVETESFCRDSGLEFWVDPHNSDPTYTRVRIRNQILPALETELGAGVIANLAKTADLLQSDLELLDQLGEQAFRSAATIGATKVELNVESLTQLHPALRSRVFVQALAVFGQGATKTAVTELDQLVTNWHGQKELTLPGVRVVRHGNTIALKTTKTLKPGAC